MLLANLCYPLYLKLRQSISILPTKPKVIYLMGGGIYNKTIINGIKSNFDNNVIVSNEVGINGEICLSINGFFGFHSLYLKPIGHVLVD